MINPYKSSSLRFIFGLIFIVVIYSIYYLVLVDNVFLEIPRRTRHFGSFLTTIIVYFIGTFHLGKLSDTWMSSIWHFVHISGLCILTICGGYDWLVSEISLSLRSFVKSVQEVLISPVLYVGMGLINKSLNKQSTTQN